MSQLSSIIPALRYRDAKSAIVWLCDALRFKEKVVFSSDDIVHHALLTFGSGMIMLSSKRDTLYDQLLAEPIEIKDLNTQSSYIYVEDLDAHYNHVLRKGVDIVLPLTKEDHGSGYTVRDLEGHLWSFGDYNPWKD